MKLKKFFAGVVAAAMMLTMGATAAFAAAPTGADQSSITITKKYTQAEGTTAPAETFYLEQVGDAEIIHKSTTYSDAKKVPGLDLTEAKVEFTGAGEKNFVIKLPNYADVGVFRYTVKEVAGNGKIQGVDYQLKSYYVNVYSFRNDDGVLYRNVTVTNVDGDQTTKVVHTESTYDAGKLTVTKKVSGALGDRDQNFIVKVTFTANDGEQVMSQINATTTRENGFVDWTVTTGTDVAVEGNGKAFKLANDGEKPAAKAVVSFKIKHDETVTFENIPANVTYKVEENDYSSNAGSTDEYGYTTSYDKQEGQTVAKKTVDATVMNAKGGTIDTGVILDNAPYIALLAIVAFGGVALVLNKRRRDEE